MDITHLVTDFSLKKIIKFFNEKFPEYKVKIDKYFEIEAKLGEEVQEEYLNKIIK